MNFKSLQAIAIELAKKRLAERRQVVPEKPPAAAIPSKDESRQRGFEDARRAIGVLPSPP